MVRTKNKNVDVTLSKFSSKEGTQYKVTRKYAIEGISDTKFFKKSKDAKKQLKEWRGK